MFSSKNRVIAELLQEIVALKGEVLRWRDGRDALNRELGGLRVQNVQLQRDNAALARQMEMVLVQLAVANDERTALLRRAGVGVADSPLFHVEHPTVDTGTRPPADAPWHGTPVADEEERDKTLAALESAASASLFEDPGNDVAAKLGRTHNDFGEVEYTAAARS